MHCNAFALGTPLLMHAHHESIDLLATLFPLPCILLTSQLGAHHMLEDYARRGDEPKDEIQLYTWMDATLRCAGSGRQMPGRSGRGRRRRALLLSLQRHLSLSSANDQGAV